jgi:hypothetical protein
MYSTNYKKKQTATPRRSALLASMKKNSISSLTNKIQGYLRRHDARTFTPMIDLLWDAYPEKDKKLNRRTLEKFVPNFKRNGIKMKLTDGRYEPISIRKMANFFLNPDNSRKIIEQHACEALKKAARNEVKYQTTAFREKEALKSPDCDYADGDKYHVGHDYEKSERFIEIFEMFCKTQLDRGTKIEVYSERGSYYKRFKDKGIAKRWAAYHQKNTILRMERAVDNLQGNRGFEVKDRWIHEYAL